MRDEHREDGSEEDPDDIKEVQRLPSVVDDQHGHHGDRGVHHAIYDRRLTWDAEGSDQPHRTLAKRCIVRHVRTMPLPTLASISCVHRSGDE
jgi:hypothetical protein